MSTLEHHFCLELCNLTFPLFIPWPHDNIGVQRIRILVNKKREGCSIIIYELVIWLSRYYSSHCLAVELVNNKGEQALLLLFYLNGPIDAASLNILGIMLIYNGN